MSGRQFETFSYLPPFTAMDLDAQIMGLLAKGLTPMIEHTSQPGPPNRHWTMWRLPMFGETAADAVRRELDECAAAHPRHHVRLIGYDPRRQTAAVCFVVRRPKSPQG